MLEEFDFPEDEDCPPRTYEYTLLGWFDGEEICEPYVLFEKALERFNAILNVERANPSRMWFISMFMFSMGSEMQPWGKMGAVCYGSYELKYEGNYKEKYKESLRKADEQIAKWYNVPVKYGEDCE